MIDGDGVSIVFPFCVSVQVESYKLYHQANAGG
jgi:hypothetical protein